MFLGCFGGCFGSVCIWRGVWCVGFVCVGVWVCGDSRVWGARGFGGTSCRSGWDSGGGCAGCVGVRGLRVWWCGDGDDVVVVFRVLASHGGHKMARCGDDEKGVFQTWWEEKKPPLRSVSPHPFRSRAMAKTMQGSKKKT